MIKVIRYVALVGCGIALIGMAGAQGAGPAVSAASAPWPGYSAAAQQRENAWEMKFRALPKAENLKEAMKHLSARPHHLGSPYDAANARWILEHFKQWGWDAHIETFDVLFPTPKERLLEMVAPRRFRASLREPAVAVDPTSKQQSEQLPTYNAYSADGDVTAPLVYVNQGVPKDYDDLDRMGISVKGAIVIARYGGSWRGIKPKVAAEHGAVGCIIYSDPRGDGYFQGDTFPHGAWRPPFGVQRGSVMDMPLYPGDPQTPGRPSTPGAQRIPLEQLKTLTKIPVLPISYSDAKPLLAALDGPVAPERWRGALGITYHVGPGPARVHLVVRSNWRHVKLHDVIARLEGASAPGQWVLRGNHQDAWVNGAEDPISGQVAMLEEARSLGELVKQGWRPQRTIIYAAWDGEEEGLLGSTEWAEAHAAELERHAVAYVNSDSNGRGYLGVSGSHTLAPLINGIAREVKDPETGLSVAERLRLRRIRHAKDEKSRQEIRSSRDLEIGALGSGSDYTVFLDHLGVSSLNLGFGGESGGGIYHSIYDDYYWYTHFGDTDFVYGRALAQTAGSAVLRLADAEWVPLDFTTMTRTVAGYVKEVKDLLGNLRVQARERDRELDEGVFKATTDPRKTYVPPPREAAVPYLNFAPLDNGVAALEASSRAYNAAVGQLSVGKRTMAPADLEALNRRLIASERALTTAAGLPGRPWFRHQLYAPGFYTGYGVKTLPAVREAIEQKDWKLAQKQIEVVGETLEAEAGAIQEAAAELEKLGPGGVQD